MARGLLALAWGVALAGCQGSESGADSTPTSSTTNAVPSDSQVPVVTTPLPGTSSPPSMTSAGPTQSTATATTSTTTPPASSSPGATSTGGAGGTQGLPSSSATATDTGAVSSSTASGSNTGGSGGDAPNTGGTAGTTGGAGGGGNPSTGWSCPAGLTGAPTLGGTPTRVMGVPPEDAFNMNGDNWGNVEGPVWIDDALYVSEMSNTAYTPSDSNVKQARMLKVTADGSVSIFIADSGSNGLAIDLEGNLLAGVHKDGSISRFALSGGAPMVVVGQYMGKRFNSPNDLAVRSDGTIYFSDPSFQAPATLPQPQTYVYRLPPGGEAEPIPNAASPEVMTNPNGVTLSLAEDYLYVAAANGRRFAVMDDGTLGAGEDFPATSGSDGMAIDCAGNLYVTKADTKNVEVFTADGDPIGTIMVPEVQAVTNVAFGGMDHQTLYITGHGNEKGLFTLPLDIPGRPY